MRIFGLTTIPVLFLINIGLECYNNWPHKSYLVGDLIIWRLISVIGREVFNGITLLLMVYYGSFRKTFLSKFSLFALLFMALGLMIDVSGINGGAILYLAAVIIIAITYTPHFDSKGDEKTLLDWLKYAFVISFVIYSVSAAYWSDMVEYLDKFTNCIMFAMFMVFYIWLLKISLKMCPRRLMQKVMKFLRITEIRKTI